MGGRVLVAVGVGALVAVGRAAAGVLEAVRTAVGVAIVVAEGVGPGVAVGDGGGVAVRVGAGVMVGVWATVAVGRGVGMAVGTNVGAGTAVALESTVAVGPAPFSGRHAAKASTRSRKTGTMRLTRATSPGAEWEDSIIGAQWWRVKALLEQVTLGIPGFGVLCSLKDLVWGHHRVRTFHPIRHCW